MLSDEKNIPQNMRSILLGAENDFSSYRYYTGTCKCGVGSNITDIKVKSTKLAKIFMQNFFTLSNT